MCIFAILTKLKSVKQNKRRLYLCNIMNYMELLNDYIEIKLNNMI